MSVDFSFLRRMCSCPPPMLAAGMAAAAVTLVIVPARGLAAASLWQRPDPDGDVRHDFEGARCRVDIRLSHSAEGSICKSI